MQDSYFSQSIADRQLSARDISHGIIGLAAAATLNLAHAGDFDRVEPGSTRVELNGNGTPWVKS